MTGRAPNTKRLNLEAVGVELDKTGAVKVTSFDFCILLFSFDILSCVSTLNWFCMCLILVLVLQWFFLDIRSYCKLDSLIWCQYLVYLLFSLFANLSLQCLFGINFPFFSMRRQIIVLTHFGSPNFCKTLIPPLLFCCQSMWQSKFNGNVRIRTSSGWSPISGWSQWDLWFRLFKQYRVIQLIILMQLPLFLLFSFL